VTPRQSSGFRDVSPYRRNPKTQADGAMESGIPAGEQQDERSRRPEQLFRHVSDYEGDK